MAGLGSYQTRWHRFAKNRNSNFTKWLIRELVIVFGQTETKVGGIEMLGFVTCSV